MSETPEAEADRCDEGLPERYLYAGLVLLTCVLYGRCVGFEFLNWDDTTYIAKNALLLRSDAGAVVDLFKPHSIPLESLYVPLTYLSYWIEIRAFGLSSTVCHAVNVALHCANGLLVMAVCLQLTKRQVVALAAAILFVAHPLQVESVAWAFGRKDLLATLFSLAALWIWLKGGAGIDTGWRWVGCTTIVAVLAMLAKPSALILPGLFILVTLFLHARRGLTASTWTVTALTLLASIVLFAVNQSQEYVPQDALPLATRVGLWPYSLSAWLPRILLFQPPMTFYPWPQDGLLLKTVLGIGVIVAILALIVVATIKRWRIVWFSLTFTALGFAPTVSTAIGYREFFSGDRYGYFPLMGVFLLGGTALSLLVRSKRTLAIGIASVAGVAICWSTTMRISEWRDSVALWSAQIKKLPHHPYGHVALAKSLDDIRDASAGIDSHQLLTDAQASYRRAVELGTKDPKAFFNMANNYYFMGRYAESIAAYQQAILLKPDYVEAMINLARVHMSEGAYDKAVRIYRHAADFDSPHAFIIYMNLATAYEETEKLDMALEAVSRALKLKPGDPDGAARLNRLKALQPLKNQTTPKTP